MIIYLILTCLIQVRTNMKLKIRALQRVFGVGTKPPKNMTNCWCTFIHKHWGFKFAHCIFERVLGVVGYFKKNQIFMENRAPAKWVLF